IPPVVPKRLVLVRHNMHLICLSNTGYVVAKTKPRGFLAALLALTLAAANGAADARTLAPTPPMGWNSWDAYGLTIGEADYRANVEERAALKRPGWSYAVINMGWYMANPAGDPRITRQYQVDGHGLLQPYG